MSTLSQGSFSGSGWGTAGNERVGVPGAWATGAHREIRSCPERVSDFSMVTQLPQFPQWEEVTASRFCDIRQHGGLRPPHVFPPPPVSLTLCWSSVAPFHLPPVFFPCPPSRVPLPIPPTALLEPRGGASSRTQLMSPLKTIYFPDICLQRQIVGGAGGARTRAAGGFGDPAGLEGVMGATRLWQPLQGSW